MPILYAVLAMAGLGMVMSAVLGLAAKIFYVYVDPRVDQIADTLPGANCGGCGYAGCNDFAEAVVEGGATPGQCVACGKESIKTICSILGVSAEEKERKVARIFCRGTHQSASREFSYRGIADCRAAELVSGGEKSCQYGCLGLGTCVENCPFGAMAMGEDGLPIVFEDLCTACGQCAKICPRDIPRLVPASQPVVVFCGSHESGKVVKELCSAGCIGCGKCKKVCPEGAISINKFLAVVDPEKCTGCGLCLEECPTGIIRKARERAGQKVEQKDQDKAAA
jgi:Na+-translocating ferredoxin:NAD+ oxidoreductase RNF subunit RnfB